MFFFIFDKKENDELVVVISERLYGIYWYYFVWYIWLIFFFCVVFISNVFLYFFIDVRWYIFNYYFMYERFGELKLGIFDYRIIVFYL